MRLFAFCELFVCGLPSTQDQRAEGLCIAERVLAEATNKRERKRREWQLCPHCQQPFIVDQMNCGQFTCGQDFHGTNNRGHGCGETFNAGTAGYYMLDQAIIQPLQSRVNVLASQCGAWRAVGCSVQLKHSSSIPQSNRRS